MYVSVMDEREKGRFCLTDCTRDIKGRSFSMLISIVLFVLMTASFSTVKARESE